MLSNRSCEKSLVIKQDDKFFSRLLSRDLSMSRTNKNGSFRGLPSSVPFTWESQPGTPKHQFYSSASQPPPLTPPPSYYSAHSHKNQIKIRHTSSSKSTGLFNKLNFFKWRVNNINAIVSAHQPSSPSISSYSFSSSPSSFACSSTTTRSSSLRRIRFGSWGGSSSSNSSKAHDHEEDSVVSPSSTLCFMTRRKISRNAVWDLQKKELISMASK
ncbi:hypothetical protein QQ045_005560 [Rhodiola kirilowii]